jgi:hypothetical protein
MSEKKLSSVSRDAYLVESNFTDESQSNIGQFELYYLKFGCKKFLTAWGKALTPKQTTRLKSSR